MRLNIKTLFVFVSFAIATQANADLALDRTDETNSPSTCDDSQTNSEADLNANEFKSYCTGPLQKVPTDACIAIKAVTIEKDTIDQNGGVQVANIPAGYFKRQSKASCEEFCVVGYEKKMKKLRETSSKNCAGNKQPEVERSFDGEKPANDKPYTGPAIDRSFDGE